TAAETLMLVHQRDPVSPGRLVVGVPRDLETICLKCLRKEPEKRYASAQALADDLERFRTGQPITARPVGPIERARKWARRWPAAAALVVVSAAALLALGVGGWLWALSVVRAHDREVALREAEEVERQKAEENFRDALEVVDQLLTRVAEVDLENVP